MTYCLPISHLHTCVLWDISLFSSHLNLEIPISLSSFSLNALFFGNSLWVYKFQPRTGARPFSMFSQHLNYEQVLIFQSLVYLPFSLTLCIPLCQRFCLTHLIAFLEFILLSSKLQRPKTYHLISSVMGLSLCNLVKLFP